jgi:hypothetical protein
MNKKYLNKVVDILVSETTIDGNIVSAPFINLPRNISYFQQTLFPLLPSPAYFSVFVIDYYGLTEEEIKYVWKQYRDIINNKI